jgi:GSH-dependent disulfide-bond oxidoreductase
MIDLYYWPTPNGHKIVIFLEETGLEYKLIPVNITKGDQFNKEFLKISPNNKMPAIIDHAPNKSKEPIALFESGAILEYLADKSGRFLPALHSPGRYTVLQWLYWQVAGLGPMAGQNHHFSHYAPEKIPYAIKRYQDETHRLYRVLNQQLGSNSFVAGEEYSIADMAIYPWIVPYERQGIDLNEFQALKQWFEKMQQRPAVVRAYKKGEEINHQPVMTDEAKKVLFGQR